MHLADEVRVEGTRDLGGGQLLEEARLERARIVHEHVDAAEPLRRGLHRGLGLLRARDVERDGEQVVRRPEGLGEAARVPARRHQRVAGSQDGLREVEIALGEGRLRRVAGAITWIKAHFAEPLQIEDLAKGVSMSPSALHAHFRAAAGVSPIQYQKRLRLRLRLRLEEARRLLLAGGTSAEAVAYEVGYASPSQFNREYARLFGAPPRRDAERLRLDNAAGSPAL
jgi:AraC-like DNA-binding protein